MNLLYQPTPVADEGTNLNLRRIADAIKNLGVAVSGPTSTQAYRKLGALAGTGTIVVPSGARRIRVLADGEASAGGTIKLQVNGIAAAYQSEAPSDSGVFTLAASWALYTGGAGATSFSAWADVTYGPAVAPQAFYQGAFQDTLSGYLSSDGFVPCPAGIASLALTCAGLTQVKIDAWAEF